MFILFSMVDKLKGNTLAYSIAAIGVIIKSNNLLVSKRFYFFFFQKFFFSHFRFFCLVNSFGGK